VPTRAGRGFADDTNESIGYLLRDASRRILGAMTKELEAHGLSLPQYFVLRELYQEEGLTQRELANRVGVLEPTIVATLDALEKRELIERVRSTTDRRKVGVMLTPAGNAVRDTLLGYAATVLDRVLSRSALQRCEISAWILHAGGRDVLNAMEKRLGLEPVHLSHSAAMLYEYGNLSSAFVYFVLDAALRSGARGGWWWLSSFGAGFSCYGALLQVQ